MRWSLDSQGALAHVSQEWRAYTGLAEDEVIGRFLTSAVHPEDQGGVATIIHAAVAARLPFLLQFRLLRADASFGWAMAGGTPSFAPVHGSLLGYLGVTELLDEAPDPPEVTDILHQAMHRSKHKVVMLDTMADHVMAARRLAKHNDDAVVTQILDFALLTIGDRLYQAIQRGERSAEAEPATLFTSRPTRRARDRDRLDQGRD